PLTRLLKIRVFGRQNANDRAFFRSRRSQPGRFSNPPNSATFSPKPREVRGFRSRSRAQPAFFRRSEPAFGRYKTVSGGFRFCDCAIGREVVYSRPAPDLVGKSRGIRPKRSQSSIIGMHT